MPPAFYSQQQTVLPGEVDRHPDIRIAGDLRDEGGAFVEGRVENASRLLVRFVAWQQQIAPQTVPKLLHGCSF